jgi:hypothetical protein
MALLRGEYSFSFKIGIMMLIFKSVKLTVSDKTPSKKGRSDNQFQGKLYLSNIFKIFSLEAFVAKVHLHV